MINKMSDDGQEIKNNFDSKCSFKIETNSRGHNTTTHIYQGCTEQEINETIDLAIKAHNRLQDKLYVPTQEKEKEK